MKEKGLIPREIPEGGLPAPVVPARPEAESALVAGGTRVDLESPRFRLEVTSPLEDGVMLTGCLGSLVFGLSLPLVALASSHISLHLLIVSGAVAAVGILLSMSLDMTYEVDRERRELLYRYGPEGLRRSLSIASLDDVAAVAVRPEWLLHRKGEDHELRWQYRLALLLRQGSVLGIRKPVADLEKLQGDAHALARALGVPVIEGRRETRLQLRAVGGEPEARFLPAPVPRDGKLRREDRDGVGALSRMMDPSAKDRDQGLAPVLKVLRRERNVGLAITGSSSLAMGAAFLGSGAVPYLMETWNLLLAGLPKVPALTAILAGFSIAAGLLTGGAYALWYGLQDLVRMGKGEEEDERFGHIMAATGCFIPFMFLLLNGAGGLLLIPIGLVLSENLVASAFVMLNLLGATGAVFVIGIAAFGQLDGLPPPDLDPSWPLPDEVRLLLAERLEAGEVVCPYCAAPLVLTDAVACTRCETMQHRDCWDEGGRCATYGCPGREAEPVSRA